METPDIETSSERYASRFSGAAGAWMLSVQEKAVLNLLRNRGVSSVLDLGGGHGQLTGSLIRAGYEVTVFGSDAACQTRISDWVRRGDCKFAHGNLLKLPFDSCAFDAVVSVRLLSHVAAWPLLIREMARVANRAVVVDYPTLRSINFLTPLLFQAKKGFEKNTREYTIFDEAELLRHFNAAGFKPSGRVAQFFVPMVAHRMVQSPAVSRAMEFVPRICGLTALFGSPVIARFERGDMQ